MSYLSRPSIDASNYRERLTYLQESRQRRMHGGTARSIRHNLTRNCSRIFSPHPPSVVEGVDYSYPYTGTLSPLIDTSLHLAGLACAAVLIFLLSRDLHAIRAAPRINRGGGKEISGIFVACLSIIVSFIKLFPKMSLKTRKFYPFAVLLGLSFLVFTVAGGNGGPTRSSNIGGKYNWVVALILTVYWFLVAILGYRDSKIYAARQDSLNGRTVGPPAQVLLTPLSVTPISQAECVIRDQEEQEDNGNGSTTNVSARLGNADLPVAPPPAKISAPKVSGEVFELEMQAPRTNAAARHRRRRTTVFLEPEPRDERQDDDAEEMDPTRNQNRRMFLPPETFHSTVLHTDEVPLRRSRRGRRPASVG
ncbi:hypothetical protein POJ06DRAFT_114593 [Lipomyces tetrasporus]|uniref:Uncharacterized protein n=1 Tax=Lipomyces tetrasporus TaxID=54092 RepID=A0AAD7QQZ2_9ASCO|nr:uncharacterized protein POJ06DRAFT_114593 [Lipomyces tetrasporus]KAJ8099678.1 hypothetical protein POJ06DRAFT_114593 [Lipomyces tetrasporus]